MADSWSMSSQSSPRVAQSTEILVSWSVVAPSKICRSSSRSRSADLAAWTKSLMRSMLLARAYPLLIQKKERAKIE